jgi:hypothetical protein
VDNGVALYYAAAAALHYFGRAHIILVICGVIFLLLNCANAATNVCTAKNSLSARRSVCRRRAEDECRFNKFT